MKIDRLISGALALIGLAMATVPALAQAPAGKPNILFILGGSEYSLSSNNPSAH